MTALGISYCIVAWRAPYCRLLIEDLVRKTTVPFEILIWLDTADAELRALCARTPSVKIVGASVDSVGMVGLRTCFESARYPLVVQIDDDVIRVAPKIAETCDEIMRRHPSVKQIVSDVWQDDLVTGARPPMAHYTLLDKRDQLYDGPIDGWFSAVDRKSLLAVLPSITFKRFLALGGLVKQVLAKRGEKCVLTTRFKVFHLTMSQYMLCYDVLDQEIAKYRRVQVENRCDLSEHLKKLMQMKDPKTSLSRSVLEARIKNIYKHIDRSNRS